jgi:hypothetical protein
MQITKNTLDHAAEKGLITPQQADGLWHFLNQQGANTTSQANSPDSSSALTQSPKLSASDMLYYLGGCIAIAAMTLFMNLGWERFGGEGLSAIALSYAVIALALTEYLQKKALPVPAGIMAALAVAMVPLFVYGIQTVFGFFDSQTNYRGFHKLIDTRWVIMELVTVVVGLLVLLRYRFSFVLIGVALLYMSVDLAPLVVGAEEKHFGFYPIVMVWFGLALIAAALLTDLYNKSQQDHAYWLYLFGVLALWIGVTTPGSDLLSMKLLYIAFNLVLIAVGTSLMRRVFLVFGGIGVLLTLGDLSHDIFKDSIGFPFSLTVIGLMTIGIGIWWQRNEPAIQTRVGRIMPRALIALREHRNR